MASESSERTPLLGGPEPAHHDAAAAPEGTGRQTALDTQDSSLIMGLRVKERILLAGFLIALSFGLTPVP